MPINFPSSPSNNQLFVTEGKAMRYNATKNRWKAVSTLSSSQITDLEARTVGVSSMSISGNTLVIQKDDSSYANVSLASFAGNKLTTYANASILPLSDLVSGTQVYVEDTDSLYITDGSGWYKIATVNLSPSLTLGVSSISLGSGGSVDVNYTVNEPEDTPYTVSASATSNATITVYQANNTITFDTPAASSTETITITATDGVNSVGDTLTMTIALGPNWAGISEEAKLISPNKSTNHSFGSSVAIKGDQILVNSEGNDKVYYYTRAGSTWTASGNVSPTAKYYHISVSNNVNRFIGGRINAAVDVWTRSGNTFTLEANLVPTFSITNSYYGYLSHQIDDTGTHVLAGAPQTGSTKLGKVAVFKRSGSTWTEQKTLQLSGLHTTSNSQTNNISFGASLGISGNTIVVGSNGEYGDSNGAGVRSGAAHVYEYTTIGGIVNASYDSVSFSVSSQESDPTLIAFNLDGSKMLVAGGNTDNAYEYSLSTPYDISTSSYNNVSFTLSNNPTGWTFNSDGTKMYVIGDDNKNIYQYDLSSGFDLSTASYANKFFYAGSKDSLPVGIALSPDGKRLIMMGRSNQRLFQFNLSTAFDISTAVFVKDSSYYGSFMPTPSGMTFNKDGSAIIVSDSTNDTLYKFDLGTSYDLAGISSTSDGSFNISTESSEPRNIVFNNDGSKMFVIDKNAATIYQYSTPETNWVFQQRLEASTSEADTGDEFGCAVSISGNTMAIGARGDRGSTDSIPNQGAVYIFTKSGSTWSQQAKLFASDAASLGSNMYFGAAIKLQEDVLVVGASRSGSIGNGAGYIFKRSGSTWTQESKFEPTSPTATDRFGGEVNKGSIDIDDDTVVAGAYLDDPGGTTNAGSAYVFKA